MRLAMDAIRMIRDIRAEGGAIGAWGALLNIPQIVGGLAFVWTVEGAVVLAAELLALAVAGQIHRRAPFSRLIGLCHLPWLAMLPWLVHRLLTADHGPALTGFLAYVCAVVAISLIFDAWDVARWLRGARRFDWAKG